MSNDININESAILETLNAKIDYDGGNYKGSGLANYVVDKTGDTMTGSLISQQDSYYQFVAKSTLIDATETPADTQHVGIDFKDKNNVRLGWFGICHDKNGNTFANLLNFSGASDGFQFPRCTTKATTTSSASNHKVAVVVQNYVSGTTWYRVWSDGWVEQGGKYNHGSLTYDFSTTITLPIKMANDTYTAVATAARNNATAANRAGVTNIFTQTTTQLGVGWYRGNNTSETMQYINWQVSGYKA